MILPLRCVVALSYLWIHLHSTSSTSTSLHCLALRIASQRYLLAAVHSLRASISAAASPAYLANVLQVLLSQEAPANASARGPASGSQAKCATVESSTFLPSNEVKERSSFLASSYQRVTDCARSLWMASASGNCGWWLDGPNGSMPSMRPGFLMCLVIFLRALPARSNLTGKCGRNP